MIMILIGSRDCMHVSRDGLGGRYVILVVSRIK